MVDSDKKFLREEYSARINRVIDYIEKNLDENLSLEVLAKVASFSQFHFHRIFSAMIGETLNQFIQRIRVEKAAMLLINNPKITITKIAYNCGFSSSAAFARAFKEYFNMSASEWRKKENSDDSKNCKTESNNSQTLSKIEKDIEISSMYIDSINQNQVWRIKMKQKKNVKIDAKIEVRDMPKFNVAYVRHIGPYKGDSELFEKLFNRLMTWAGPRGLLNFPETKVLSVYHDNPEITDEDKLRLSACITVPEDTKVEGDVGMMKISGGKFAVGHFEINGDEFEDAWSLIYGDWLPESGYQPDDRLSYELCLNDPNEHPEKKHIVDICVPVKPL